MGSLWLKLEITDCNSIFLPHYLVKSGNHGEVTSVLQTKRKDPLRVFLWLLSALHEVTSRKLRQIIDSL